MQNLMQIHCSTCSVILNVMATQYTCAHSMASTALTDQYSEVIIVHACTFQSILPGCQVISIPGHASHSHYIHNGWTFPGQTCTCMLYTHTHSCIYTITYIICIIIIIVCNNYILFLRNISEFIVVVSLSYYFK